jgi:hypothetical protein
MNWRNLLPEAARPVSTAPSEEPPAPPRVEPEPDPDPLDPEMSAVRERVKRGWGRGVDVRSSFRKT